MEEPRWVVARTKPRSEGWAGSNVARQGFSFYAPRIMHVARVRFGGGWRQLAAARPLFPGLFFVLPVEGRWRSLLSTLGLAGLIMVGAEPGTVRQRVIDELRGREDDDGFVVLAPRFSSGDSVEVQSGAMRGKQGIFLGDGPRQRARVLFDVMGRKSEILVGAEALEAA